MQAADVGHLDPFDLPEWLGVEPVTWSASSSLGDAHLVSGRLGAGHEELDCDLLAGDLAFPTAVLDERWRHDAHQAWAHGQVLTVSRNGRLTLVVPGWQVHVEVALEAIRRLAKAVGAPTERFTVALRL